MCVYCDDSQREEVRQILIGDGVKEKTWVYDKEVIEKWPPGGVILEKWLAFKGLTGKETDEIREDAHERWKIVMQ